MGLCQRAWLSPHLRAISPHHGGAAPERRVLAVLLYALSPPAWGCPRTHRACRVRAPLLPTAVGLHPNACSWPRSPLHLPTPVGLHPTEPPSPPWPSMPPHSDGAAPESLWLAAVALESSPLRWGCTQVPCTGHPPGAVSSQRWGCTRNRIAKHHPARSLPTTVGPHPNRPCGLVYAAGPSNAGGLRICPGSFVQGNAQRGSCSGCGQQLGNPSAVGCASKRGTSPRTSSTHRGTPMRWASRRDSSAAAAARSGSPRSRWLFAW